MEGVNWVKKKIVAITSNAPILKLKSFHRRANKPSINIYQNEKRTQP